MNTHLANVRCPQPECQGRIAFEVWTTDDGEVHAHDDATVVRLNGGDPEVDDALSQALNGPNPSHPWCHDHEVELDARGLGQIERAAAGDVPTPLRVQGVVRHNSDG